MTSDPTGSPSPSASPSGGFQLSRTTSYDKGVIAAAVLFLVALLLPWTTVSLDAEGLGLDLDDSYNGIGSGRLVLAWVLLIFAALVALLPAIGTRAKLPVPRGVAMLAFSAGATILAVIGFFDAFGMPAEAEEVELTQGVSLDATASFGAYLGLVAVLIALALSLLAFRASGRPAR